MIFNLLKENESLDWRWINDRRNPELTLDDTLRFAPDAWKRWVNGENKESLRRNVAKQAVVSTSEQKPEAGSKLHKTLTEAYKFYDGKKDRFEALALKVVEHIIRNEGGHFLSGWITEKGGDGGVDFYGRIDVGRGFNLTKIIVLGQAKCEKLDSPTNGTHIARTVARLQRGWIGAYVTTSYFSKQVQKEIIEDKYPLMLVNGLELAIALEQMKNDRGMKSIKELLVILDKEHDTLIASRRPEEILLL